MISNLLSRPFSFRSRCEISLTIVCTLWSVYLSTQKAVSLPRESCVKYNWFPALITKMSSGNKLQLACIGWSGVGWGGGRIGRLKPHTPLFSVQAYWKFLLCRYYNSWIENAEEQEENKSLPGQNVAQSSVLTEDSLLKLNKIEAPSMRGAGDNVEESWWQGEEEANTKGSDWSSSGSQESFRSPPNTSSKSHSISFFSSKSESSEGIVFNTNIDESVLQFGDLLDTEVRVMNFYRIHMQLFLKTAKVFYLV